MAKKTVKDVDGNYNYIRKSFRYQGQLFTVRGKTERETKEKMYQLLNRTHWLQETMS